MDIKETRARIQSRIWQALAQSDIEIKQLSQKELDELVALATDAALMELDTEVGAAMEEGTKAERATLKEGDAEEEVLWEGRPFLSIRTRYLITNERIRVIEGLLGKERTDVELVRVQDLEQSQTVRERLFSVGDIHILSHDRSDPTIVLENVQNPEEVHEILRRAVLDARKKHGLRYREEM